MTTARPKSGCWMSRPRCTTVGSRAPSRTRGRSSAGTSPQTAGSLCCEASGCRETSRGGCGCQGRSGCVCCGGSGWVGADCLDARTRKASASAWSCQAQSLWRRVPAAPGEDETFIITWDFVFSGDSIRITGKAALIFPGLGLGVESYFTGWQMIHSLNVGQTLLLMRFRWDMEVA